MLKRSAGRVLPARNAAIHGHLTKPQKLRGLDSVPHHSCLDKSFGVEMTFDQFGIAHTGPVELVDTACSTDVVNLDDEVFARALEGLVGARDAGDDEGEVAWRRVLQILGRLQTRRGDTAAGRLH